MPVEGHVEKILCLLKNRRDEVSQAFLHRELWEYGGVQQLFVGGSLCEKSKVRVLIHECLKLLNPGKSDLWVLRIGAEVFDNLRSAEYRTLATYLRRLK